MASARTPLLFVLFVSLGLAVMAADPPAKGEKSDKPARPTREQVAQWIKQLGDNEFDVREAATLKLWEAGDAAEAALTTALKSDDVEVVRRAQEVLDKFKLGIYPNTPRKIVDVINRYKAGDTSIKETCAGELIDAGSVGCKALLKLIATEDAKGDLKAGLVQKMVQNLSRALPLLLAENDVATIDAFLAAGMTEESKIGISNAAAYWLLRGQLDQKIDHYKDLDAKGQEPKEQAEILAYLYRAKGDMTSARAAAGRTDRKKLIEDLAAEAGDWKELARTPRADDALRDVVEKLGFQAAYHRLAGNEKEFEETLAALRKNAAAGKKSELFYTAKAFFLNNRPKEALEFLTQDDNRQVSVFEILVAQMKYRDAFAIVDKARNVNSNELPALEVAQARTLYNLGEKDKATQIFGRLGEQIQMGNDFAWFEALVDAEYRVGLTDQAFAHAVQVLTVSADQHWKKRLFGKLFGGKSEAAVGLWDVLKVIFPLEDNLARMKRLRDAVGGKIQGKEVARWIENAEPSIKNAKPEEAGSRWLGLAEAALACGQEDKARLCLEKAGTSESLLKLGDLLAAKKEWDAASERYYQAWEKDQSAAMALYLSGKAMIEAGKTAQGKKRVEYANWLPLGNEYTRDQFCDALAKRGDLETLKNQTALQMKLSQPNSFAYSKALRLSAFEANQRKDLARSADLQERAMVHCLQLQLNFVADSAYVVVPSMIARLRARSLLAAGKTKEALALIALCHEYVPASVDVAVQCVPELDRLGQKKEADELFTRCVALHTALCKEYPKCSWGHNSIAWLSATCRRNLDDGLAHALTAVELAPKSASHLDTLSEIYFQRGDKDKAIETEKKVIALEPKRVYFRKQLKRIEMGDPKAPLPLENEDDEDE